MSSWRPTVAEERALALARQFRQAPAGSWRGVRLLTRCAFFVLGFFAALATLGTLMVGGTPHTPMFAGLVLIAVAEWLIFQRRLFFSGIEEALELCGALMIAFDLAGGLHSGSDRVMAWFFAGACLIAGWRLLNPPMTTLAALAVAFALREAQQMPGWYCFGVAILALGLGGFHFKRPAHDRMLDGLVMVMPLAGYLYLQDAHLPVFWVAGTCLTFAALALLTGVWRRTHAPLCAVMLGLGCVGYELRHVTGLALEVRLMLWGTVTFLVCVALDRGLRVPRRGITSNKLTDREGPMDLLEIAGAASVAPRDTAGGQAFQGAGGQFAGGGASGKY